MMNIVVTRKTSLCADTFARTMLGKNATLQRANSIKALMLNQFIGYINQISGLIRKPEKRYWIFNDGLGGAWRFDFVVYPVQQLVIICAFYAVAVNRTLLQRQTSVLQQNEGKSNVMRLSEADLRYIVSEATKQIICSSNYQVRKIGNWDCVPSNGYEFYDIQNMGMCVGIAMYVDCTTNKHIPPTYCLFRRGSNGKYFYATIVDAPEKGPTETKFLIVPVSDVPQEIYKDRYNLNLLC